MTARLLACPSCARHIRVDEEHCPFCRVALPDDFGVGPTPVPPARRMGREELYRYGRSGAALTAAAALVASAVAAFEGCATAYGHAPFGEGFDAGDEPSSADVADAPLDALSEADGDAAEAGSDAPPDVAPDATAPSDAGDGG